MTNREAIEVFNKWIDCKDAYQADPSCDGRCSLCEYYVSAEEEREAMQMAISALEKQEQTNAQSVNSMRTFRPNALESLNILEQAKDDKGCVPMSLVRQAFRNVMEQDRWNPCSEKMPAEPFGCFVTVMDTNPITQEEFENILPYFVGWDGEQWNDADGERIPCEVLAWRPLPKPYKLEKKS